MSLYLLVFPIAVGVPETGFAQFVENGEFSR
jgi:hypothetical protein